MGECETWAAVRSKAASDDCSPGTVSQTGKVHDIQILWGKKEKDLVLETQMHPDEQNSFFLFVSFLLKSWILPWGDAFKQPLKNQTCVTCRHTDADTVHPFGHWIAVVMTTATRARVTLGEARGSSCWLALQRDFGLAQERKRLPSPETCCTWTEHERLKSLPTPWRDRCEGGEACLVSTSKSLQLSTSAVSITARRGWQGQPICYAACALFRQTHRMCQG